MLREKTETIAALATPPGTGGVGIVRVSGSLAEEIIRRLVGHNWSNKRVLQPRFMELGIVRDDDGTRVDEVLWVWMPGPNSFTGEDVVEFHGHGGPANMQRILRTVVQAGARIAEPGEFSRRAFENGRMDLTEAEAIVAVVSAQTERALQVAQKQLAGSLGETVRELREVALTVLAEVEATIDFPEEELEESEPGILARQCRSAHERCNALVASAKVGMALLEGVEIALVGPVNAGKSSLLNALVEEERALVDASPGTTRDVVEARVSWDGIAITLVDTAGARDSESRVESRGIELGRARASRSSLIVELCPAADWTEVAVAEDGRRLRIASKVDEVDGRPAGALCTSAETGEGLEELKLAIVSRITADATSEQELLTNERQRSLVAKAAQAFLKTAELLANQQPREIISIEARTAAESLSQIVGEGVGDEMLDALFAKFCLGK